jgi:hypothetical protein
VLRRNNIGTSSNSASIDQTKEPLARRRANMP